MITEQNTNWLKEELETLNTFDGEKDKMPSLKMVEKEITTFTIIADKPFEKWVDQVSVPNVVKKIIPVLHDGQQKNFWLNVKNPLYCDILNELINGKRVFSVFQTGTGKETKYTLVKD